MRIRTRVGLVAFTALFFAAGWQQKSAAQNVDLVQNGDFEAIDAGNDFITYRATQSFMGWVVDLGSVDLSGPRWMAATGKQSIDLTGSPGQGAISQTLRTQSGRTYRLRFALAGNPECERGTKQIEVWWGNRLVDTITFDTRGRSNTNMGWRYYEYTVTASSNQTRLQFRSRSSTYCGPMIDSVSVVPTEGVMEYIEQDVLVVIYTRTNGGVIAESDLPLIQASLDDAKAFYQRNTASRYNINYSYLVIRDYRNIVGEHGTIPPGVVEPDLRARGIRDDQFDGVIVIAPGSGAYMWGSWILRTAGYCQSGWFGRWHMPWFIVHEYGHVIDWHFDALGYPNYPHNHPGVNRELIGVCGPDWDVNADICRRWQHWLELGRNPHSRWGRLMFTRDADGDGLPDNDRRFVIDEARFGSRADRRDTDGDGLSDLGELMAGILTASNPQNTDTDGDSIRDGSDPYPLYPVSTSAPFRRLTVDSSLANRSLLGSYYHTDPRTPVSLYINWDSNYLHIVIRTRFTSPPPTRIHVHTDNNNDGLFHGSDNYHLTFNTRIRTLERQILCDANVPAPHDCIERPLNERILTRFTLDRSQTTVSIAIPRNPARGLDLRVGEPIGLRIVFEDSGHMFEPTVYFRFTLN